MYDADLIAKLIATIPPTWEEVFYGWIPFVFLFISAFLLFRSWQLSRKGREQAVLSSENAFLLSFLILLVALFTGREAAQSEAFNHQLKQEWALRMLVAVTHPSEPSTVVGKDGDLTVYTHYRDTVVIGPAQLDVFAEAGVPIVLDEGGEDANEPGK